MSTKLVDLAPKCLTLVATTPGWCNYTLLYMYADRVWDVAEFAEWWLQLCRASPIG